MSVSSDGDYFSASFAGGIQIAKGLTKEINVKGDLVGGTSRTSIFDVEKSTDIFLTGNESEFGITPTAPSLAAESDSTQAMSTDGVPFYNGITLSITAGTLPTVSNSSAKAPVANIALNNPNTILGAYRTNIIGEPISVGSSVFRFTGGTSGVLGAGTASSITNIRIEDSNGNIIAGPEDNVAVAGTQGKVTFADTIEYPVGPRDYVIKVNLSISTGTWATGYTLTASTTPSADWTTVKGVNTGDTVTLSNGLVTLSQMTVRAGSLNVILSSQPAAQVIVSGLSDVEFARVFLDANSSGEDVRVSNVPMQLTGSVVESNLTNCQLYDGSTSVNSNSVVAGTAGTAGYTFTLNGSGLVIPKGVTKTLSLKCDTQSGTTTTAIWGLLATDDASVTGVSTGTSIAEAITTNAGQTMTFASGGSYTVTSDSSILYKVAQAGTSGVTLGSLRFDAGAAENVLIKQIALELGATASNSPTDLVGQSVSLWNGGIQIGTAQFAGSNADYATSTLSTPFTVPKNESVVITIKGDLAAQNATDGTPGAFLQVNYDGNNNGTTGNYGTGYTTINGSSADQSTNGLRIFRSIPTVAVTSSSCTTCLSAGADLYKVKITAGSGRDIGLRALTFNVSVTGLPSITFDLVGPASTISNVSTSTAGGTDGLGAQTRLRMTWADTDTDRIVKAGLSNEYTLRVNTVTGLTTTAVESVSIKLQQDTAYPGFVSGNFLGRVGNGTTTEDAGNSYSVEATASTTDRFVWTPFSTTTPPSAGTAAMNALQDWTNGYGVPGFPSLGQDMSAQSFSH